MIGLTEHSVIFLPISKFFTFFPDSVSLKVKMDPNSKFCYVLILSTDKFFSNHERDLECVEGVPK